MANCLSMTITHASFVDYFLFFLTFNLFYKGNMKGPNFPFFYPQFVEKRQIALSTVKALQDLT